MASPVKTEAIVVWDIENTRVPVKLLTRCYEIVQWLLEDISARAPNTTVVKVYVAGTFDNYPAPIKTALCTHPRVQLLYSIGKVAKGGEADDALKRCILDFHSNQLAAGKQAVIALLSGDADYNNEVDAARVANHQVFLYHSSAVAHTLRGNVDYSELWHDFLARKSGEPPDSLEDVGFVERHTTPQANMGSATNSVSRGAPQTPPISLQPIPIQYCTNSRQRKPQYQQTPVYQGKRQFGVDNHRVPSMQLPMQSDEDDFSSTKPKRLHEQGTPQSGTILQEALQSTEGPQPGKQGNSQRLGSANSAAPIQTPSQRPVYKQTLLTTQSLQSSQTTESTMSSGVTPKPYAANSILVQRGAPITDSTANPCSDGRSIVISGFKRGIAGFEAKERALAACKPFGAVGSSWVRKGRTGCWFVIAQFDEAATAEAMVQQGCSRYGKSGALAVRWYLSDAPNPAAALPQPQQPGVSTMPLLVHPPPAGLPQTSQQAGKNLDQQTLFDKQQIQAVAGPRSHMKSMRRTVEQLFLRLTVGTQLRLLAGGLLLSGYFALLAAGF